MARGLVDKDRNWWGVDGNPISVKVVGGSAGEGGVADEVAVTNWPETQYTVERAFKIVAYGYIEITAENNEVMLDPQGATFSLRNFDMEDTVFFALESGKMDEGIPILPRNATRGYVTDGPVYIYANTQAPIRVYYQFFRTEGV